MDWPENPENIVLIENAHNHKSTRVRLENDRLGRLTMLEDGCLGGGPFQFPERQFGLPCPFPFDIPTVF